MGSKPSGISGSRAATVLGLNQWQTPVELWQRIMEEVELGFNESRGYVFPEDPDNAAIRWGNAFEDANVQLTEEKLGESIGQRERMYRMGQYITCHVDGIISGGRLYEGKTTSFHTFDNLWTEPEIGKIPRHVMIQVQHNMMLTGCKEAVVSVLVFPESPQKWEEMGWAIEKWMSGYALIHPRAENACYPMSWARVLAEMGYHHLYYIKANEELHELLQEKYSAWWKEYVIGRKKPKPMNADDVARLCPDPSGTVVLNGGEIEEGDTEEVIKRKNEHNLLIDAIAEMKSISKEMSKSGTLSKRKDQLKAMFLDGIRKLGGVEDDESKDKWVIRDAQGKKIAQWAKDKRGFWVLR